MIPIPAIAGLLTNRWTVLGLALAGACIVSYHFGASSVYKDWIQANEKAAAESRAVVIKQQIVTEKIITKWRTRTVKVQGDTQYIEKEIVRYVPASADPVLAHGWVQLHDAAATGAIPKAPAGTDVAAPAVASSVALKGVVENYGTCHRTEAQLLALQEWIRYQYEMTNQESLGY